MPKKKDKETSPARAADKQVEAVEKLFDLIARLIAREHLRRSAESQQEPQRAESEGSDAD